MKRFSYIGSWLVCATLLCACSSEDPGTEPQSVGYTFHVQTRVADGKPTVAPDDATQYTCLYVAERPVGHTEDLHCAPESRYKLTGGQYDLLDLYGQWYKFAFVCVPVLNGVGGANMLTEENPVERTCDFNKLLIDYTSVLRLQKTNPQMAATSDLNIYRQVIDRWIDPQSIVRTEDVEMKRITSELIVDMGIPADQFPVDVKSITLTLKKPNMRVYVRDAATGEVISDNGNGGDMVYELDFSGLAEAEYSQAMERKQKFHLCLLPEVLNGTLTVNFKQPIPGGGNAIVMELGQGSDQHLIEVRKNQITTVLYNGMTRDEFEVRYAGFDDDAQIGVEDDNWNGWSPKN